MDAFVRDILEDSPRVSDSALGRQLLGGRSESMRTVGEGGGSGGLESPPNSKTRLLEKDGDPGVARKSKSAETLLRAQSIFRYSLIFINFTFIVAAMLLIMAGIVARANSAVKLCDHCGDLTLVAIIYGVALWLFAIFGFNWIRQRNILLLLVYVAFLGFLAISLLGVIIAASVYDANAVTESTSGTSLFQQWKQLVNSTDDKVSPLCELQRSFNCSGYQSGCCVPGACYNVSNVPPWVAQVCPNCTGFNLAPVVCTNIVSDTLKKNLGGFLVISCFAMLLVLSGVLLAFLARKVNQSAVAGSTMKPRRSTPTTPTGGPPEM